MELLLLVTKTILHITHSTIIHITFIDVIWDSYLIKNAPECCVEITVLSLVDV